MIDDILLQNSLPTFFVGDAKSDMECALNAKSVPLGLVGTAAATHPQARPVENLLAAAQYICTQL